MHIPYTKCICYYRTEVIYCFLIVSFCVYIPPTLYESLFIDKQFFLLSLQRLDELMKTKEPGI